MGAELGEGEVSWHTARDHYPGREAAAWGRHKSQLGFVGFNSFQSPGGFGWKLPSAAEPKGLGSLSRNAREDKCCYSLTLRGSAHASGTGRQAAGGVQFALGVKPFPPHMPVLASWRRRGCGKPQGPLPH